MKIQIKSRQDYGTHIEEMNEKIECEVVKEKDFIELKNNDIHILIYDKKIIQNRNGNEIIIEEGKVNETDYLTPYGVLKLITKGIAVMKKENTVIAKYKISLNGQEYMNELEIEM